MNQNPFPGPQPYRAADRARFFTRDALAKKLVNQVLARPATMVFGASGTGKSSLVQAAVIPILEESDGMRVVRVDAWARDKEPLPWFVGALYSDLDLGLPSPDKTAMEELTEAFELATQYSDRPILIFLDQLEQIFAANRSENEMNALLGALSWLIQPERPLQVHVVLAIREDYVGRYHDWARERAVLSAHVFHVRPLSVAEMVTAMCQTAAAGNPSQTWDPTKIRELMLEVRVPGQRNADDAAVQTAFAQIVCRTLWEEEAGNDPAKSNSNPRGDRSQKHVKAETILRLYLDETLEKMGPLHKSARTLLEQHFIDNEGHRRLLTESEARHVLPDNDADTILGHLEHAAILRAEEHQGSRYFELGHDWLAKKLLARRLERQELARIEEERSEARRLTRTALLIKSTMIIIAVLGILLWWAQKRAHAAKASALVAGSRELLAKGEPGIATRVLLAVKESERHQAWQQAAIDCIVNGIPKNTFRHEARVAWAAWNQDGTRIVTASYDKTARVWDLSDERTAPVILKEHNDKVHTAAWSPDGNFIVTADQDGKFVIWNAHELPKPLVVVPSAHEKTIWSVAWSPDSKRFATASRDETTAIWNIDGFMIQNNNTNTHSEQINNVSWHPDKDQIITASDDTKACIWDAENGKQLRCLQHPDLVNTAAWNRDGSQILTASYDGKARIWNAEETKPLHILDGHTDVVWFAAWNPDGTRIVTASNDKTVRLWDKDGSAQGLLMHGLAVIWSAAWSPDGKQIVTTSDDNTARVWDVERAAEARFFGGYLGIVNVAAWSPDGKRMAYAGNGNTVQIVNTDGSGTEIILTGHTKEVVSLAWSLDGQYIATASRDHTARVWNADGSGKPLVLEGHQDEVTSVAWAHDQKRIATTSKDKTVRIWDHHGSNRQVVLEGHGDEVVSLSWSPDDTRIVTASRDKTARIWKTDGSGKHVVLNHDGFVNSANWSPDGKHVVTASSDKSLCIWQVDGFGISRQCHSHDDEVVSASWSHDGWRIVSASKDNTVRVWNTEESEKPLVFQYSKAFTFASFSPDDKRILATVEGETARIWPIDTHLLGQMLNDATNERLSPEQCRMYLDDNAETDAIAAEGCEEPTEKFNSRN